MAECDAVCEHAHLPLQSGSTRVLKAMRRTYCRERYLRLVDELRAAIPDLALTTDIIVGFPGETEARLRGDARGRARRSATTARSRSSTRRGRARRRRRCRSRCRRRSSSERIERLVEVVQRRRRAHATANGSAASRRFSSRARAEPTPRCSAAARAATRRSTSTGRPPPGELVAVTIEGATSTTLKGDTARSRCSVAATSLWDGCSTSATSAAIRPRTAARRGTARSSAPTASAS